MPANANYDSDANRRRRQIAAVFVLLLIGAAAYFALRDNGPSEAQIAAGRALFVHQWSVDDSLAGGGDGLGPVFNARSCVACHSQAGVGGGGGNEHNVTTFEVDPDRDRPQVISHVVHAAATSPELEETQESVKAMFRVIPGGIRVVAGCTVNLANHHPVRFQEINSPALFGAGVLDEVSDWEVIKHNARRFRAELTAEFGGQYKRNGKGFARSDAFGRIGKFGWKGQFASIQDFVAAACAMELGLTNPSVAQPIPREHNEDPDAELDMTQEQLDQLVAFVKSLPPPRQVLPADPVARQRAIDGESLFNQIHCNDCHVKDLGPAKGVFTDFQLYSLERTGRGYGNDEEIEFKRPTTIPRLEDWKTPPLWGVADSAPYFHDGRSPTLEAAVQRHLGDAQYSHDLFNDLSRDNQQMIIEFLQTLRAPELAEDSGQSTAGS